MIVINKTLHGINLEHGKIVIPGTNILEDGALDTKHPVIAAMIAEGQLTVRDNLDNQGDAAEAIANANTAKVLEQVKAKAGKSEALQKAAEKRKKELDDFDRKVAEGIKKAKGKK